MGPIGIVASALMTGVALFAASAIVVAIVKAILAAQERLRAEWDSAATAIGVARAERGFFSSASAALEGVVDGLPVSVKGYEGKAAHTVYEIDVPFREMRLTSEGIGSALGKLVAGDDVRIGDALFDEKALVRGDPHEMRAVFDAETRALALDVLRLGGWVADGKIQLRQNGFTRSGAKIVANANTLLALGRRLAEADRVSVPTRLAAVAAGDPLPAVRQEALASLLVRASQDRAPRAVVDDAVVRALEDPHGGNRFFAATCGRVALSRSREVLAALVRDSGTADALCAKALVALGKLAGVPDADALLDRLLERGGNESRVVAIEALGLRRAHPSRVTTFATRGHAPTRAAVALALERIGDPSAQPLLLSMVDDADESVRLAAIQALGVVADVGAVEALLPLTRGVFGGDLKQTAQEAVAKIQSRVAGAAAGQLSVSDASAEAGALSAIAEGGALSEPGVAGRAAARKTPA